MTIQIVTEFEDGREQCVAEYADLAAALQAAIILADTYGSDDAAAAWVHLRRGDDIALTLRVFRGGLTQKR
jgi:hypothetical protein